LSICKNDIHTLVDVVIIDSMGTNFSWFCASNILSNNMLENDTMVEILRNEILKSNNLQWVVQIKENMHELKVIEDHMPLWDVGGKGRCCCQLVLRLQKGRNVD
jgi:hypothetical protein